MTSLPSPSDPAALSEAVRARARELGFALVGIAEPLASGHGDVYREWLEAGYHGEMEYLEREDSVARREDLSLTMEEVRSVVVVAHPYFQEDAPGVPDDPSLGVIARYARGRDYHKVVKKKLLELLRWMDEEWGQGAAGACQGGVDGVREAGNGEEAHAGAELDRAGPTRRVSGRAYVDTGPILERELAQRAGLGWFGRNTMLIHPRRGSYFFLGTLLLDVELEPDEPFEADHCGTCRACLDACPTGALLGRDESGAPVMDARRCISYLTIENRGPIPEELRPLMGNRVYGCDICQEVCPFNVRFAEETAEPGYAARRPGELPVGVEPLPGERVSAETHPGTAAPSLVELMEVALDPDRWEAFSRGSAIRRAGRAGFARNVCVALGNWGSPEAVPVLSAALEDAEPIVRGHAAWALGRIRSGRAQGALEAALAEEPDVLVRQELESALHH